MCHDYEVRFESQLENPGDPAPHREGSPSHQHTADKRERGKVSPVLLGVGTAPTLSLPFAGAMLPNSFSGA